MFSKSLGGLPLIQTIEKGFLVLNLNSSLQMKLLEGIEQNN